MIQLTQKQKIIVGIIIIGIFFVIVYYFYQVSQSPNYEELEKNVNVEEIQEEEQERQNDILIHITGAVKQEGVVYLKEGARIIDAIEEAGGLLEDANLSNVNLAYPLSDGQKIYIPNTSDETEEVQNVSSESGKDVVEGEKKDLNKVKININTAAQTELEELPGIGTSTAYRIIQYRQENGKFSSIEDIKNVSGIGEAKFNQIKDLICVK